MERIQSSADNERASILWHIPNTAHGESTTVGFKSCRPHQETQTAYLHRACSVTHLHSCQHHFKNLMFTQWRIIWQEWQKHGRSTCRLLKGQNDNISVQRAIIFMGGNSNWIFCIFSIMLCCCIHVDIHTVATRSTNHSVTTDGPSRLFWGSEPCSRTLWLHGPRTDDLCIYGASIPASGLLSSFKQSLLYCSCFTVLNVERPFHDLPVNKHSCRSHTKKGNCGWSMSWKQSHVQKVADLNMTSSHKQWFQNDFLKYDQSYVNKSQPALLHVSLEGAHLLLNRRTCRNRGR